MSKQGMRSQSRRALTSIVVGALLLTILTTVGASPASAAVSDIQGWIGDSAGGTSGVKVDLFSANGDGSRGQYLRDTYTDGNGNYYLDVNDGCFVITMVAPSGRTFTNGSQWNQQRVCVQNNQSPDRVNGNLNGGAPPCEGGQPIWNLEFEDHFSGNGSPLNSQWSAYNSAGNRGYGLRRPSAISLWGGSLNIRASMENGSLVSGGMEHSLDQTYGRYEFRVRTDQDFSNGTSGVVLTWPQSNVHPRDGENNIYETLATPGDRHEFYSFIHKPYGTVHDQDYTVHNVSANQWHTMVMEWAPNKLVLYRDGQVVKTIWENGADLIPDNPHHMAIQLDAWDHSIPSSVWMQVDYVKIWSYGGETSC